MDQSLPGMSPSLPSSSNSGTSAATYLAAIRSAANAAARLEQLYQTARRSRETRLFAEALEDAYAASPDNLLYAAWHYRLEQAAQSRAQGLFGGRWRWAIPLGVLLGLALWLLSEGAAFVHGIVVPVDGGFSAYGGV